MTKFLLSACFVILVCEINAQQLLLLDRANGNRVVNDSTIVISSSDPHIIDLTAQFTMKNNSDKLLSLNLRKTVHFMADSTIDYFCFGVQCWPSTDTTNYPDTLQPGAEDYTFASHVVHFRRFEMPPLPSGKSSITYTIYDDTSYPETIEASVTVIYDYQNELGVSRNALSQAVVYPNPVTDLLTISTDVFQRGHHIEVNIFHHHGGLVKSLALENTDNVLRVPVDELSSGHYYGLLITKETSPVVFRFIK